MLEEKIKQSESYRRVLSNSHSGVVVNAECRQYKLWGSFPVYDMSAFKFQSERKRSDRIKKLEP